ncbi:MAG: S9 family peptidase [Steroidobacteraceae bacterium]
MNRKPASWLLAWVLFYAGTVVAQQAPPKAAAFARLPDISMVRLSPDGQRLAWAGMDGEKALVTMFSLADQKTLNMIRPDDELTLRNLSWADNKTLLMHLSLTRRFEQNDREAQRALEIYRLLAVDATGGPTRVLLLNDLTRRNIIGAQVRLIHSGLPGKVIMSSYGFLDTKYSQETGSRLTGGRKHGGWVYSLFEVDTATGRGSMLEGGTPFTVDWIVSPTGQPVARAEWNVDKPEFRILANDKGAWRTIYTGTDRNDLYPSALTAAGDAIVAVGARGGNREKAWRIPLDGSEITAFFDGDEDIENTIEDRFTGAVAGFQLGGLTPRIHWLDPRLDQIQGSLGKAFPGRIVSVYDRTADYARVLARVEDTDSPPVYYLIDLTKGTADTVGESYPELADVPLGIDELMSYRTRDGIEIPAYLTLPPGLGPKMLPLVVLPHGGPQSRDDAGFDWWVQFLATRGYAVLRPQFRGSTGFGAEFRRAGTKQWGQAMQDDISDGIQALVQRGTVDPARVCIVGASYGGYAALTGAAFTPELYACAASVNGITDLGNMYGYIRSRFGDESNALAEWEAIVGQPYDGSLAEVSPTRSAASIRAPILLIHGTDDTVVPYGQSETFARALKQHDRQFRFITLKGEDHWLSGGASRLEVLQALERFLAEHLGN